MNLPLVLDIAIGLFFIYLILSLLASEIQEYFTTLFQWRAKHLKKSIENLLVGDDSDEEESKERKKAEELTQRLYNNPLIAAINQESKEIYPSLLEKLTSKSHLKKSNSDGKENAANCNNRFSGPSYIPSETFTSTLLETLRVPLISHIFIKVELSKFKNELLLNIIHSFIEIRRNQINIGDKQYQQKKLDDLLDDLLKNIDGSGSNLGTTVNEDEAPLTVEKLLKNIDDNNGNNGNIFTTFKKLKKEIDEICEDFEKNKSGLDETIKRIESKLEEFKWSTQIPGITDLRRNGETSENDKNDFTKKIDVLIKRFFGETERKALIRRIQPTLTQIINVFKKDSFEYELVQDALGKDDTTLKEFESLPESLKKSLSAFVYRSQSKVETVEQDVNQLRKEIELWFDRSMERASGVYKRQAKGVAILIAFSVAIAANADTFYIISRLSTDTDLRNTITKNADAVNTSCQNPASTHGSTSNTSPKKTDLECVRDKTKEALEEVPLPIGWSINNVTDQWNLPDKTDVKKNRSRQWNVFGVDAKGTIKKLYPQYLSVPNSEDLKFPESKIDWLIWLLYHGILPIIGLILLIFPGMKILSSKNQNPKIKIFLFISMSFLSACLVIFTGLKVILGVFLGWSVSAVAISMGASFWFDLIGKFINIRNTGPKPVSSTNF